MPKISVIISAHKERGYLDEAIRSAKNQFFTDYEIILSSDGNPDLISYAKKYDIDFCLTPKNCHSSALNHAVKVAKGEWIKECHDDDLLTENCLIDLYNAREGADLVYGHAIGFVDKDSTRIINPYPTLRKVSLGNFLPVITCPVHSATILFKRNVFLNIGGLDPLLSHAEDYDFYLNLLSHGYKFQYCKGIVAWYRKHEKQNSVSYYANPEKTRNYISKKLEGYLKEVNKSIEDIEFKKVMQDQILAIPIT